jgi:hypothetical protein
LLKVVIPILGVALTAAAYGEELALTITTVSHTTDRFGYTIRTPETSNANCNVYGNSVNCNSTTYGGGTQQKAVYRMTEVVMGNGQRFTLQRTARWVWQNTDFLNDGETFEAKVKGRSMYITCRRGGNQGKKETIKYEIMDIRGEPLASVPKPEPVVPQPAAARVKRNNGPAPTPVALPAQPRPASLADATQVGTTASSPMKWTGEWHVVGNQLQCVYHYNKVDGTSVSLARLIDEPESSTITADTAATGCRL